MIEEDPMLITGDVVRSIESSVLCWLATVTEDGSPNVSPKEAFLHDGHGRILIAHIASPGSVRNIENNPQVCVSFIDVFTQKGHKVRGCARVLREGDTEFSAHIARLKTLVGNAFPILTVIEVTPSAVEEIIAPSYHMMSGTTAEVMIAQSLATYRVAELRKRLPRTESQQLKFVEGLEHSVWQAVMARDGDALASLFSDDYVELTLTGKRCSKGQVVVESPQLDEIAGYQIEQAKVITLANGALLLNYQVTIDGTFDGQPILPPQRWATSIWRQESHTWKCCFFQQSPYPERE